MYALDAYHGLSFDDRRFYYDPINEYFLPIYYDGKSKILNDTQKSEIRDLSKGVSIDAKTGALNAIKLIKNLNHDGLKKVLSKQGVNISGEDYEKLIKKIMSRLEVINNSDPLPVRFLETEKYFSKIKNNIIKHRKLIFVNLKR